MKGIILAGGKGTRMLPLTKVTSKHLLPVGGKPMLQHSIDKMVEAGITEIMIVTGGEHLGAIAEFCGSGKDFGCEFTYRVQDEAGGIAQALGLANGFIREGEQMCVILGDNIFKDDLKFAVEQSERHLAQAMVMVKEVPDPKRFGVAEVRACVDPEVWVNEQRHHHPLKNMTDQAKWFHESTKFMVMGIVEKPSLPKTNFAVTGIYFYGYEVFDIIDTLKPSHRGELEITDVNNEYVRRRKLTCTFWKGWWTDAGTPKSYRKANELVEWTTD